MFKLIESSILIILQSYTTIYSTKYELNEIVYMLAIELQLCLRRWEKIGDYYVVNQFSIAVDAQVVSSAPKSVRAQPYKK